MSNDAMRMPKRAIYWNEDAGGWYDLSTDVAVENMGPPEAEWSAKLAENAARAASEARQGMSEIATPPVYGTLAACATCGHEIQYVHGLPCGFLMNDGWIHTDTSVPYSHHIVAPIIENGTYVQVEPSINAPVMQMNNIAQRVLDRNVGLIISIARAEAEKVLAEHMVPEHPFSFFEDQWLVTFGILQGYVSDIAALQQRIAVLERPWWQRWRNR